MFLIDTRKHFCTLFCTGLLLNSVNDNLHVAWNTLTYVTVVLAISGGQSDTGTIFCLTLKR